ncbi:fish-egg lectin-like [Labeo rohita]|uniref:fish-egg lectin-like n=1 Tax=Labeo rohita TaxID=84645 RepID=UPI0021E217BB|nr:fish-egg lectin-like [Labeo rohita]
MPLQPLRKSTCCTNCHRLLQRIVVLETKLLAGLPKQADHSADHRHGPPQHTAGESCQPSESQQFISVKSTWLKAHGAMVYQSILLLFSCHFLHTLALHCTVMSGNLKQIDAGSGSVVGVNSLNEVFVLIDNVFTKISGSLTHVSVGPAGWLGVDSANNIFKFQSGSVIQFPGLLKQVDAGGDQIIAGVNMNDDIFCLNMDVNNKWPSSTTPWVSMNGKLKYYSCGPYSCWGVNSYDQIWMMRDVSNKACSGSGSFQNIPGQLAMIEVATDGSVFGVSSQGMLFQRIGVTRSNPAGTDWISIVACPSDHKHVSFDLGLLWVVCIDGSIRKCTL